MSNTPDAPEKGKDFIRTIIDGDNESGKYENRVHTRFPPEPNGYLHIGHAKSICLNFGVARDYEGKCNLRFDDTNPVKEDTEYVNSIKEDVTWLGFEWDANFYASDYFEKLYYIAELFIKMGTAYVDHQTADEIRENRGTLKTPGTNSPYRDRSPEENLELFRKMRAGDLPDGECILRGKIDMGAANFMLRDPALYRIKHADHHRTGDAWCIYPMYDFTHGLSDAIEGITHSLCTLEFENNRPVYNWCVDTLMEGLQQTELFGENEAIYTELAALPGFNQRPYQYEFARLNITGTILSKRKLIQLVEEGHVSGWDDPRMPTISGFRRRGYTPESIRNFCEQIGVSKAAGTTVENALLEHCVREDLNKIAPRYMGIMDPVKLVIENFPEDQMDEFEVALNPEDESYGSRTVPFTRELWIERADFMEEPPKKFFRMGPGREVRLRAAYYVECTGYDTDDDGNVTEIRATLDPDSKGGWIQDGRKVKGTMHWVSATQGVQAEVRNYTSLFTIDNPNAPEEGKTFVDYVDPNSLETITAWVEPAVKALEPGANIQFERTGYFCADSKDHIQGEKLVFNRTATLRDSWAKIQKKMGK